MPSRITLDLPWVRSGARALLLIAMAQLVSACGFLPISRTSRVGAELIVLAPKPPSVGAEFEGCGPEGHQPDHSLNGRKNRTDEGAYLPVDWGVVARLPWPREVGYRFRDRWTSRRKRSIVTEITPRVRAQHPRWTTERLDSLQRARVRVRLSGWLMLDQMHPEQVGRNRSTLWEVHPIMRIEWQNSSLAWVSLDSATRLPSPP